MVRQRQADLLLIAATVIAACGWIFSREAIAGMPVFAFLGLRFFFAALLRSQGFQDLRLLSADSEFAGVRLQKTTSGQHGSDRTYAVPAMAERLGEACGVVFRHPQEKTLWLVGDTIWRDDIAADLLKLRPDVVVLNAGYAHVIGFGPIIMGKEDLLNVHFALPEAKIMAIHLEAVNHCLVSREEMRQYALDNQIADVVSIPQDGETVVY